MSGDLRLSSAQLKVITGHAIACKPEEACGILAGDAGGTVRRVFLTENALHSSIRYDISADERFEVFDTIWREGLELLSIFHSHPHSPAQPSAVDLRQAVPEPGLVLHPGAVYIIISLMGDEPVYNAFRIVNEQFEAAEVIVEEREP